MGRNSARPHVRLPGWLLAIALLGAASALLGGYWDDAWHTERGRDTFFIAPHIAIYAGIAAAGGALTAWLLLALRAGGTAAIREHHALLLALASVSVTLASGPIDNIWHEAFGRDAVIWSAPHLLGIAGTLGLAAALLLELSDRPGAAASALRAIAGAGVLAAASFTVVEYDTDVPQFAALWYLPALTFAAALALAIVRMSSSRGYAATEAAVTHLAFVLAVSLFLPLVGFDPPGLPLLVLPALVLDLGARAAWSPLKLAAAFAGLVFASYVPVRNWLGSGVEVSLTDTLVGAPMALAAAWLVFVVAGPQPRGRRRAPHTVTAVLAAAITAALAAPAVAHDPGQGKDAGQVRFGVAVAGSTATARGGLSDRARCRRVTPRALVARRAGREVRRTLTGSGCAFRGRVRLPERGRWFVYAELSERGRAIETWLPVAAGGEAETVSDEGRYAYEPARRAGSVLKVAAAIALYAVALALLGAALWLSRAAGRARAGA